MRLHSWLGLPDVIAFLSNTWLALLVILIIVINVLGNKAYIIASRLHGLRLVKNLMPSWTFPVRKRVRALRVNVRNKIC
jgi:choline-glycine betaine transporter